MAKTFINERPKLDESGMGEVTVDDAGHIGDVARPLSTWEKIQNITALRRAAILIAIAVIWQVYAALLDNPLMLPTFWATAKALFSSFASDQLLLKAWQKVFTGRCELKGDAQTHRLIFCNGLPVAVRPCRI